jgi:LysR family pca operon transcriptional activator
LIRSPLLHVAIVRYNKKLHDIHMVFDMRFSDRLKLRHMEVFIETARRKSVTRAAEALNLTQPAVSRTLRELEAICGKPLFIKDGRGIRLSPFGAIFLDYAGRSLALARDGLIALNTVEAASGPPVRIGALPTIAASVLPHAVAQFRASGLKGQLQIITGENQVLLDQLRARDLDLVMGRMPAPENMLGLSFDPLFKERVVAVVQADHPLTHADFITSEDLASYPVLLPSAGSIIHSIVERLFVEQGLAMPLDAIETVLDTFGRSFTKQYQAIWFISQGVVAAELSDGTFRELPLDTETTRGFVGLSTRRDDTLSPPTAQFCAILRQITAER